ncbi:MAG: hypothetical protein WBV82_05270 [Myxococcaceae bacterium]
MNARAILTLLVAILVPAGALAESAPSQQSLWALDAAWTRPAGSWSIGVFAPARYAFTDTLELEVPPLVFLVAPTATVRVAHVKRPGLAITGEYGFSVPTFGLGLTRGYLFSSGAQTGKIGWFVVPQAGLVATIPVGERAQLTGRASVAVGLPVAGETTVSSLDSPLAPLDLMTAPLLRRFRARVGAGYDRALLPWLRLRTSLDGYLVGSPPEGFAQSSPLFISGHVGLDFRVGGQSRFTLGGIWWNWDQFHSEVRVGPEGFAERVHVRSNDFLPTIDFIWSN